MKGDVILASDPRAATIETRQVWRSRRGRLFADEAAARQDGATHSPCRICGALKADVYPGHECDKCRAERELKRDQALYAKMPVVQWDGRTPVYSLVKNEFYDDPTDLAERLDADERLSDWLITDTVPIYPRELSTDSVGCELEDDTLYPSMLLEAIDEFNTKVKDLVIGYDAGKNAIDVSTYEDWNGEEPNPDH